MTAAVYPVLAYAALYFGMALLDESVDLGIFRYIRGK
jgi:hypothetical protein